MHGKVIIRSGIAAFALAAPAHPQDYQPLKDFVPEGDRHRRFLARTIDKCEAACERDAGCKAYAFRAKRPACYWSRELHPSHPLILMMGIDRGGLSVASAQGFVSATTSETA